MWGICLQHAVGGALCLPALLPAWFPNVSHAAALSMVRWYVERWGPHSGELHSLTRSLTRSLAHSLAPSRGALCEVAWEVTDTLKRVYQRCLPNGAELQPNSLLFLLFCHHSLSTLLVVPTNVMYSEFGEGDARPAARYKIAYAEMIFSMQAAAAIALVIQQYTQALDVKGSGSALTKMFFASVVSLVIMVYTRGVRRPTAPRSKDDRLALER